MCAATRRLRGSSQPPPRPKPRPQPLFRMPNDCINHITIYADTPTIERIVAAEGRLPSLVPPIAHQSSEAAAVAYGTDRFYIYKLSAAGPGAVLFKIYTAWAPPNNLLETLLKTEKGIEFIKCQWDVEDGGAGVWIGERGADGATNIRGLEWVEGCYEERAERFGPPVANGPKLLS